MRKFAFVVFLPALLSSCAPRQTLYFWGHYEEVLYRSYAKPGEGGPEKQIEKLEQDYQVARSQQKPMPPGWHANLGYLYYQTGKLDEARQEFKTEKAAFPESTVFMDRLLAKFQKS